MAVELTDPDDHPLNPLYHHVAIATGPRQVFLAGQVAWDEHGELVAPGDLAGQVVQVYRNIGKGLHAAGAGFDDLVRITWYVVGWRREMADAFADGVRRAAEELGVPTPPASLIGVDALFERGILVEAEATAVVG